MFLEKAPWFATWMRKRCTPIEIRVYETVKSIPVGTPPRVAGTAAKSPVVETESAAPNATLPVFVMVNGTELLVIP